MPKHFSDFAVSHCTGTNYLIITMLKISSHSSTVCKKYFEGTVCTQHLMHVFSNSWNAVSKWSYYVLLVECIDKGKGKVLM